MCSVVHIDKAGVNMEILAEYIVCFQVNDQGFCYKILWMTENEASFPT